MRSIGVNRKCNYLIKSSLEITSAVPWTNPKTEILGGLPREDETSETIV